jgi:uncharacterized protein (DUF2147 family)
MKTLTRISWLLMVTAIIFMACQKEVSLEKGNATVSVGSLSVDGSGNCMGAVVSGTYFKDTAIKASNYVDVSVQVDTAGTYTITTDTVNGYYFKASGTFNATGAQAVRLVGGGKPLAAGTNIFTVTYNGTTCEFSVTVTAAGPPPGGSAVFTVACTGATPTGTYVAGTALTASNSITLNVNVTTVGSWSVTTAPAVNGMTFSGTGTFTNTGAQTIALTATGTPTAAGTFTFTVTGATATCTFQCTVTSVLIPDYFPRTINSNWSYQYDGDPDDSSITKVIAQTHSAMGNTYNIFMYSYDVVADGFDTLGYYRRTGANYYEGGDISWGLLDDPIRTEYIFLKDDQTVGSSWTSAQFTGPYTDPNSGTTFNVTLRWVMTIQQQNQTVTVGATSYPNTIVVKQELQQMVGAAWQTAFYLDNFYALNKGLIKQDFYAFDQASGTFDLGYVQDVRRLAIY